MKTHTKTHTHLIYLPHDNKPVWSRGNNWSIQPLSVPTLPTTHSTHLEYDSRHRGVHEECHGKSYRHVLVLHTSQHTGCGIRLRRARRRSMTRNGIHCFVWLTSRQGVQPMLFAADIRQRERVRGLKDRSVGTRYLYYSIGLPVMSASRAS